MDLADITDKVTAAYQAVGNLAFSYGQGSVTAGFAEQGTLDLVMVWDRNEPPRGNQRPVAVLHEGSALQAAQFDHLDFVRDRFLMGGRSIEVAHYTLAAFDRWIQEVRAGHGWEEMDKPLPLYAVAGFAYGRIGLDDRGLAEAAKEKLTDFPTALIERSRSMLLLEMPSYDEDLDDCVRRGDGFLFHELLSRVHRHALVAWFAAEHRYCPHPKWINKWIARLGLSASISGIERAMWGPVNLARRHELFLTMVERVIALSHRA
ncbi:MAG TPA: DUF4037 domain-containing protein [Actinopolymorphaceae bacterium]